MRRRDEIYQKFTRSFIERYPDEVARHLETRPFREVADFLASQTLEHARAVLDHLTPAVASETLGGLDPGRAASLLAPMDANRSALWLSQMDEGFREAILRSLDEPSRKELQLLLSYAPDSSGSFMDPRVLTFHPETTVREALAQIRRLKGRPIVDVFTVDPEGRLVGAIALQDFIAASGDSTLDALTTSPPTAIGAFSPRDEAVELFEKRRLATLPVVDFDGRLLGVIRQEAIMRAAEQEAIADMQSMVGASREERALSRVLFAIRKRLPWLHVNLATAFLAAAVVGIFENTIAKFTALAVLLPVVAGQSGNSGAQALAVTMRGLALREIRVRQWPRVLFKEARVGLVNGLAVALTTSTGVYLWSRSLGLSLIIGIAMVLSMVIAGIAGAMTPMMLTVLGQDPATSSSIILTTVTDVAGFFSFLGLATLLAGLL